ncbi:tail fiber assembly protein [Pseudomonas sp. DCB_BI]|uniref:tail fiber assembly protein n=1 Tax=Pseudomonas sp. DCB_BI TaxID=2993594 RepID=UPI00224A69A4|nr:tail fiber assembly protein [Pseudomonas sp. DCB_BI]MCX2891711.1 tail fiber assembly protein [Pseudomonas sp. DCB_BI]
MENKAPKIYNYHGVTREYIGESVADADPLDVGAWLIPGNACLDSPPASKKGHVVRRSDDGWEVVEDNRGAIYSTEDGAVSALNDLGPIPDGYTSKQPPSQSHTWSGTSWRLSKELENAALTKEATATRAKLLVDAAVRMGPLQDAVDIGEASDAEKDLLVAWKRYRVYLNRIELQEGFPKTIVWPQSPDEEI